MLDVVPGRPTDTAACGDVKKADFSRKPSATSIYAYPSAADGSDSGGKVAEEITSCEDAERLACEATAWCLAQDYASCKRELQHAYNSVSARSQVCHAISLVDFLDHQSSDANLLEELTTLLKASPLDGLGPINGQQRDSCEVDAGDFAVPALNKAILLFQQHHYLSAITLLEPLYARIDTLDGGAAVRVCFLLLDIYLRFRQFSQATGVIGYLHQALPSILAALSLQPAPSIMPPGAQHPTSHPLHGRSASFDAANSWMPGTATSTAIQNSTSHPLHARSASFDAANSSMPGAADSATSAAPQNPTTQMLHATSASFDAANSPILGAPHSNADSRNASSSAVSSDAAVVAHEHAVSPALPAVPRTLISHPLSVSQGPFPCESVSPRAQVQPSQDAHHPDGSSSSNKVPAVAGYTGYIAALGAQVAETGGHGGIDLDKESPNGCVDGEVAVRGSPCYSGAALLCLPYVSKLTAQVVSKAEALQPGVMDELSRWEVDVKVALRVYKAQLHLLNSNTKAAKRELKAAVIDGASKQLVAMIKAQLEMCRGNVTKASRLLVALVQDRIVFTSCAPQLLNNLGVLHHHMGQHQTAALCFSKALVHNSATKQHKAASGQDTAAVTSTPQVPHWDCSPSLLYNSGLQHLMLKNYMLALKCFRRASCCFYHQPLLWLRLAESAVGVAEDLKQQHQQQQHTGSVDSSQVSSPSQPAAKGGVNPGGKDMVSQAMGACGVHNMPDASTLSSGGVVDAVDCNQAAWLQLHTTPPGGYYQYAQHCLDTALVLLDGPQTHSLAAEAHSPPMSGDQSLGSMDAALDSPRDASNGLGSPHPHSRHGDPNEESDAVQAAVWALSAYVHLQQAQLHAALSSAHKLLALPAASPSTHFLATCYAAEALCRLGMASEAMDLLSDQMVTLMEAESGKNGEAFGTDHQTVTGASPTFNAAAPSSASWPSGPRTGIAADVALLTGGSARATLYVNMAAVYVTQGDLPTAVQCAQQALQVSPNPRATLLLAYIQLAQGNATSAISTLKNLAPQH